MLRSRNYAPSPDLAPYIARHYIFAATLPDDFEMADVLLSETVFLRTIIHGDWKLMEPSGDWTPVRGALMCGANSVPMRIRVRGSFHVIGFAIRPSGWRAMAHRKASEIADKAVALERFSPQAAQLLDGIDPTADDETLLALQEERIRVWLQWRGGPIDEQMRRFEHITRTDSTRQVQDIAAELGLSGRQFERQCLASFGHSPKLIQRRSRLLDMATVIRGLANPDEAQLAALRYFDQSHLAREFKRFLGMSPQQFANTPTPLLTAGLQLRQERKADPVES